MKKPPRKRSNLHTVGVSQSRLRIPFPEAIAEGYIIEAWNKHVHGESLRGGVDKINKNMIVPLGWMSYDRGVRLHEMGHLKWSPDNCHPQNICATHDISLNAFQSAEDMRINALLKKHDLEIDELFPSLAMLTTIGIQDRRSALLTGCSISSTSHYEPYCIEIEKIDASIPKILAGLRAMFVDLSFDETIKVAREIDRHAPEPKGNARTRTGAIASEEKIREQLGQSLPEEIKEAVKRAVEERLKQEMNIKKWTEGDIPGEWGTMRIERPHLVLNRKAHHMRADVAPSWVGDIVAFPERAFLDNKILGKRGEYRTGTVLIDCSGSMGISAEQLNELICLIPHGTVAVYSGQSSGVSGILRIVGKQSHIYRPSSYYNDVTEGMGQANIIDGPALQWLGKQEHPRIWVSDALVTGKYEARAQNLSMDAAKLMRRGGIHRIHSAALAIEWFKSDMKGVSR